MRHRKKFNHLKRTRSHRKAMLSNMACSLILHKRIHTTAAKAKALRPFVEPIITKSKNDSTHSRRVVFSMLRNKEAVNELFREVSTKIANRNGGYTRIIKLNNRLGDNAPMAMIELVDYNENLLNETKTKVKRTRRRKSGSKAENLVKEATQAVENKVEAVEEKVKEVAEKVENKVEDVAEEAKNKLSDEAANTEKE